MLVQARVDVWHFVRCEIFINSFYYELVVKEEKYRNGSVVFANYE